MKSKVKATIISGAPEADIDFLKKNVDKTAYIIAADSGYKFCRKAGIEPDLIIGDFDSAPPPKTDVSILTLPVEKDDTDTFYAVKHAVRCGFKNIEILNAVGSRFDHTYANVMALKYCLDSGVKAVVLDRHNKILMTDKPVTLKAGEYEYFSLYAVGGDVLGLSILGSFYDVEGITIDPFEQFTQSNHFVGKDVKINFDGGYLLIIEAND